MITVIFKISESFPLHYTIFLPTLDHKCNLCRISCTERVTSCFVCLADYLICPLEFWVWNTTPWKRDCHCCDLGVWRGRTLGWGVLGITARLFASWLFISNKWQRCQRRLHWRWREIPSFVFLRYNTVV